MPILLFCTEAQKGKTQTTIAITENIFKQTHKNLTDGNTFKQMHKTLN